MKRSLQCALALLFLVATGVSPAFAQGASCDRACLKTLLDQYLNAVIKHDPAGLPLEQLERAGSGDLTTRVTYDVSVVAEAVRLALPELGGSVLTVVLSLLEMSVL